MDSEKTLIQIMDHHNNSAFAFRVIDEKSRAFAYCIFPLNKEVVCQLQISDYLVPLSGVGEKNPKSRSWFHLFPGSRDYRRSNPS